MAAPLLWSMAVAVAPAWVCLYVSFPGVSRGVFSAVCLIVATRSPLRVSSRVIVSTTCVFPLFLYPTMAMAGGFIGYCLGGWVMWFSAMNATCYNAFSGDCGLLG